MFDKQLISRKKNALTFDFQRKTLTLTLGRAWSLHFLWRPKMSVKTHRRTSSHYSHKYSPREVVSGLNCTPKTTSVHYVIKISVYLQKLPNYDDKFSVGQALMLQ